LLHGAEHAVIPIGQLSEEVLEARHKAKRIKRSESLNSSRKMSRKETNMDIIQILLITSDPCIGSFNSVEKQRKQKTKCFRKQIF